MIDLLQNSFNCYSIFSYLKRKKKPQEIVKMKLSLEKLNRHRANLIEQKRYLSLQLELTKLKYGIFIFIYFYVKWLPTFPWKAKSLLIIL